MSVRSGRYLFVLCNSFAGDEMSVGVTLKAA